MADQKVRGVYRASPPTLLDAQDSDLQVDVNGNLKVAMAGAGGTGAAAAQSQGSAASGTTDVGNPVKTGGVYNTTPPTLTNGQRGDTQMDSRGNTLVSLATKIAGEDTVADVLKVEERYSYGTQTTASTNTYQPKAGFLHSITILGGTAGAITVYDSLSGSGTPILPTFTPGNVTVPVTIIVDCLFGTGLTVVAAAATIIQVSYR